MPFSLEVHDLCIVDDTGRHLLEMPHFCASPGETIGLYGPSGAGKSTFLYALAGLQPRATGQVRWSGTDLLALPPQKRTAWRQANLSLIFQDATLIEELTATQNTAISSLYAPRQERARIRKKAQTLLNRFGIAIPNARVGTLSGGERQRIAIARALVSGVDIIIADEPTASLDRSTADRVIEDLLTYGANPDRLLLVASHDEKLLARMQRTLALRDGKLEAT